MAKTLRIFMLVQISGAALLLSPEAWCEFDQGEQQYIQQYCEQTYGSVYYEQEDERVQAIRQCIDEQSQYYSQDIASKPDTQ